MTDMDVLETRLDHISSTLDQVLAEQKKTNGRVNSLEAWRDRMTGAWVVVTFASPVITGLIVGWVLSR